MKRWCLSVLLVVLLVPSAARAGEFGFFGLEARAGVALPSQWDTGFSLGLSADVWSIGKGFYLYPGIRYATSERDVLGQTLSSTDLSAGAEVRYFLDREQNGWYFGAGAYAHRLERDEFNTIGGGVRGASRTSLAPAAVAGYLWDRDGGLDFFVEGRYDAVSWFGRGEVLFGIKFSGE